MPLSFITDSKADTPTDIQKQARELKHELKAWEAAFQTEHGRAPERDDLSHSPEMTAKYRRYSKLKKTSKQTVVTPKAVPERKTEILKRKKSANQEASAETHPLLPSWLLASKTRTREPTDQTSKRPRVQGEDITAKDQADIDDEEVNSGDTQTELSQLPTLPHIATTPRLGGGKLDIEGSPHSPSLQGIVGSTRSLTLGGTNTSLFKARAGKLTKTTSIPISTFGAQFRGASEILTSQQSHFSDDNEHMAESHDDDDDDEELVVEEKKVDVENKGDNTTEKFKKKATQKRGTRRVKIKPVGKDGEVEPLSSRIRRPKDNNPNLVSNNFYKLKLKNGRRAPKSTEERRLAFYKRLVGKKNKNASTTQNNSNSADQSEIDYAFNEDTFGIEMVQEVEEDEGNAEWGSLNLEEQESKSTSPSSHSKSRKHRRCLLAGKPLDLFYAENGLEQPLSFSPSSSATDTTALDLGKVLTDVWGYDSFKPGQVDAITRILNGHSTLLLLATGAGKSLVYQLPSLILSSLYSGLTVVVTPLIALMKDQIQNLPKGIKAICMSHESSSKEGYSSMTSQLISGQVQLLFISPERLQSPRFQSMMSMKGMPAIKLAVVDEAHCASEWSHNFRPAYLQLPQQLRSLDVGCVLALTGTATAQLSGSLCHMFGIDQDKGVVRGEVVRNNIALGVVPVDLGADIRSKSPAREAALLSLLRSPEMAALDSILVYVSTQASADRVAEYLTSRSIPAQSYHAGKPISERTRIQTAFMNEEKKRKKKSANSAVAIRVLVATVAFGMGLNKSNIRAVIHYNLPRSMESYVQEIGRAGRDGAPARGILLLAVGANHMEHSEQQQKSVAGDDNNSSNNSLCSTDAVLVRSWAHSDGIEPASARRLLLKLFSVDFVNGAIEKAIKAYTNQPLPDSTLWQESNTAVLELKNLEKDLDAGQIVVQTLINYLAMKDPDMFQIEPNTNRRCVIQFTRTELGKLAEEHPFFAKLADYINGQSGMAGHAGDRRRSGRGGRSLVNIPGPRKPKTTSATVDVFDLATSIGISIPDITSELYKWRARRELLLEWQDPSCVVKVTLDLKKFVDAADLPPLLQCDKAEAVEQAKEKIAQEVDQHISKLTRYISSQNDARVQDSVKRVNILESVMLSALQIPAQQTQCEFLQTAIKAYFARSEAESAEIATRLKRYVSTNNEGSPGLGRIMSYSKAEESSRCSTKDSQKPQLSAEMRACISSFVQKHHADIATGRAAARVFHGLSGPGCSSAQWIWCAEWGSLLWADFDAIRRYAQEELVKIHIQNSVQHP